MYPLTAWSKGFTHYNYLHRSILYLVSRKLTVQLSCFIGLIFKCMLSLKIYFSLRIFRQPYLKIPSRNFEKQLAGIGETLRPIHNTFNGFWSTCKNVSIVSSSASLMKQRKPFIILISSNIRWNLTDYGSIVGLLL